MRFNKEVIYNILNYEVRMSSDHIKQLKPFLSVFFIIATLFSIVFFKMEERRMSYVVLKSTRELKKTKEIKKQKEIVLAKLTRPQLVENIARKKLTLKRAQSTQIIHLNPSKSLSYLGALDRSIDKKEVSR